MYLKNLRYIQIMKDNPLSSILQGYRTQRKYRQSKRNQYLRRFQVLKSNFKQINVNQDSHPSALATQSINQKTNNYQVQHITQQQLQSKERKVTKQNIVSVQQASLIAQNQQLRLSLVQIQTEEKERLQNFKNQIQNVRNKYLGEIHKMTETAKSTKIQLEQKMSKMHQQSELAMKKNQQIEQSNKLLREQVNEANKLMGEYATEIKKQYTQKIQQFQRIFNTSNQKIEAMEKQFNEDEFIQNTLKNQQLLKSIQQNAQKAQEAGKILQDYTTLLQGKKEILVQINSNIEMKEKEIEKMIQLQGKMKLIMDKLTAEKKIYVAQNNKMAGELLEIKNLLVSVMGQQS